MRFRTVPPNAACASRRMAPMPIPDDYILLAKILAEDAALRRWLLKLEEIPGNMRYSTLGGFVAHFRAAGRPDLAALVQALYGKGIYEMVKAGVEALANEK